MDARRGRWWSLVEWTVAGAFLAGLLMVSVNLLSGIQRVAPMIPLIALESEAPIPPAAIPSRAVSVPLLPVAGNVYIQVGEFAAEVMSRLQGVVSARTDVVERGSVGERTTREFLYAGGRFFLVTEPASAGAAPRVTGIFIP